MKVFEVTDQTGSRTNDQMLAKANQIKAKLDKAEANNDIMGAFSVGPEMYDLMQNDMVPKMLKAMDIMFIRLDKMARKNKQDPKAQEILKQLPKVKAQIDAQKRNMMKSGVPLGRQDVGETTTAGSVATAAQPMGQMISRSMYNKDGTMKNGLDFQNVVGGPSKPKKAKKRRV